MSKRATESTESTQPVEGATSETPAVTIEVHRAEFGGKPPAGSEKAGSVFYLDPSVAVIDGLDNQNEVDPYNAQRIKEKLRQEDVDSIIQQGVILPVLGFMRGDEFVIAEGRQRIRRARRANEQILAHNSGEKVLKAHEGKVLDLISVPAISQRPIEGIEALLQSVAANQGRVQDGPRALCLAATHLAQAGANTRQIASALGRDMQTVRDYLTLGNASGKVLKLLDAGKIDTTAACRISTMTKDEQNEAIEELSEGGAKKVTKEAATRTAKAAKDKKKVAKKGKVEEAKPRQVADKRSVSELRLVQLGLEKDLAEGDKRTSEYAHMVVALNAVNFVLGEAYSDHDGAKEAHAMCRKAIAVGQRVKIQQAKEAKAEKESAKD